MKWNRIVILVLISSCLLLPATPSAAADGGGNCEPGSDVSGCVLVYAPPPDGNGGSACDDPVVDRVTCRTRCDCQYDARLKECNGNATCSRLATAERYQCLEACSRDF
jgi:hypothetical protein